MVYNKFMKIVLDSIEAKNSDQYTIDSGISSIELMERAGFNIFNNIKEIINKSDRVLIVCGSGGNGGDGYVIGRYLYNEGYDVSIYSLGSHFNNECLINKNRYQGKYVTDINDDYDIYIDAIFGIGSNKIIEGNYYEIINKINNYKGLKISIDIPSGINGTTGEIMGIAFKCNYLYTAEFIKLGLLLNKASNYYDQLKVIHIGIKSIKKDGFCKVFDKKDYINYLPKREKVSNKGNYGRCAIIGGSKELLGAILLSNNAFATLKVGSGYSTICIPNSLLPLYALRHLENTYILFNDEDGHIKYDEEKLSKLLNQDAIAIGMGIGTSLEVYKIISYLLKNFKNKLIIDADGLNSLSKYGVDILKDHQCEVILTPHLMEFSRLINKPLEKIYKNEINLIKEFASKYNLIINVKSNISIISDGKEVIFNINGNPSLAKGGSGDILTGITLGVIAKSHNLIKSVAFASYILGRASELTTLKLNENSVVGEDIINNISNVLNELEEYN